MFEIVFDIIKQIVIVGGGLVGWMIVVVLLSMLLVYVVWILLVELEQIGMIGVGEVMILDIINFNVMFGIFEVEFFKVMNGMFKLGIKFVNWGWFGEDYFYLFGFYGVDMNGIDFYQFWLCYFEQNLFSMIEDFSLSVVVVKVGKFVMLDFNLCFVFL